MRRCLIPLVLALAACGESPTHPGSGGQAPLDTLLWSRAYLAEPAPGDLRVLVHSDAGWVEHSLSQPAGEPWQLGVVALGGDTLVTAGAWEYAVQIAGDDDFVGNLHGHDRHVSARITRDGASATPTDSLIGASRWVVESTSELSNRSGGVIALATRTLAFSADGLEGTVEIEWTADAQVFRAYAAMCPVARALTHAQLLGDSVVQDVSAPGFPLRHQPAAGAEWWNDGVRLRYEVTNPAEAFGGFADAAPLLSWITNSPLYNKFYGTRVANGASVSSGDVWRTEFTFSVAQN